tara:strand:- start:3477 stop:4367 length:891 start_codon:yes stop_codon:yes gene_type:complete
MSKIYGFGNALIDIEIQINDDQLSSIDIPKGSMRHISKDSKDLLLKEFKDSICSINPGGSIANSLFAAENLGALTCFSCSLGDDEYGDLFLSSYKEENISFKYSNEPTGVCLVFISPDGERTMASTLSANYHLSSKCINLSFLENCDYLLFDNFSLATDSGNQTVNYCLENISDKVKVCFGLADSELIVKNLNQLKKLSNKPIHCLSGNKLEHDSLDKIISMNYQNRLVSYGEQGAAINGEKISAPKINLVNTNGAGDSLLGAFVALEDKMEQEEALQKAVYYSSKVCSVSGPRLT